MSSSGPLELHRGHVQFDNPTVTIQFDTDQAAAAHERMRMYADAAKNGDLVAGAHIAFPGMGHLRSAGSQAYTWIPANYSGLK